MPLTDADLGTARRLQSALAGLKAETCLLRMRLALKAGFDPSQPRVPAGTPDGGQWTDGGAGGSTSAALARLRSIISSGSVYLAQAAPPFPRPAGLRNRIAGQWTNATYRQQAELDATRIDMEAAVRRVQERDPRWRPPSSFYETIDGEIKANRAVIEAANKQYEEFLDYGIGPGRFAVEWIPDM